MYAIEWPATTFIIRHQRGGSQIFRSRWQRFCGKTSISRLKTLMPSSRTATLEESIKERRDKLVTKVHCMIQGYTSSKIHLSHGMKIVDAIERLGVGYHFHEEIGMFMRVLNDTPARENDMAEAALRFRLLRQHHYNAPSATYTHELNSSELKLAKKSFWNNGDFKETLRHDVDALLSLYEAAHLGKCDEDLLKSAVVFTTSCLSAMAENDQLPQPLLEKVEHALTSPTQRRMKRLEAKLYISIYENDEDSNHDILELAKLDFHILQQMHRDEARRFSLWYKELNVRSTLGPYIRERPVECYFWSLCVFYEPQYAKARMMFARLIKIFSLFDDTFDSYGTLEELHLFNNAVQSKLGRHSHPHWLHPPAAGGASTAQLLLPMQRREDAPNTAAGGAAPAAPLSAPSFSATSKHVCCLLHLHLEMQMVWKHRSKVDWDEGGAKQIGDYFGYVMSLLSKTLNEFVVDGASPLGIDCTKKTWEKDGGGVPTAVECYMKEYGVTVQEAKKALWCLVEEQWRSINQEFLSNTTVPIPLLTRVINLARLMETLYKTTNGYTHCSGVTDPISNVLDTCVSH
uniref:Terpene synthase N-terminal domain-containing protein n=1 Tax=Oryza barthii TaxID=65489 RepID=A0A0D3FRW0_9ORYZ